MAYTVPQLQISQQFTNTPTSVVSPLSALIIGPAYTNNSITAVALGTAGTGYTAPVVAVTDSTGSGAGAIITANCVPVGAITAVALGTAGSLYTLPPIVSIADPTGYGAVITSNLSGNAVGSYTVVSGGFNYTSPVITVTNAPGDSTGHNAVPGAATLSTGDITSYTVVNGGNSYLTPVLVVTDSNGSGVNAVPGTVTISSSPVLNTAYSSAIGSVNTITDIENLFGNPTANPSANPLAYGLYCAVLNSNNNTVYYGAVPTNNLAGYNAILALAAKSNNYYGIVPLTNDATISGISAAVISHINSMSTPANAKWRTCWLSPSLSGIGSLQTQINAYIAALPDGLAENININTGPRRIHYVFPDTYYIGPSTNVSGYYLAASLAATRSGAAPNQSLTNTQVLGPYYLDKPLSTFTDTQLNQLAAAGVWIVTQVGKGATAYTRQQLTGDNTNLNFSEDSITANVDSISYALQAALTPFIGIYNITPATVLGVKAAINSVLQFYMLETFTERAGNQLIGYTINSIQQDPTYLDQIDIVVTLQVPYPMNFITLSLSV